MMIKITQMFSLLQIFLVCFIAVSIFFFQDEEDFSSPRAGKIKPKASSRFQAVLGLTPSADKRTATGWYFII